MSRRRNETAIQEPGGASLVLRLTRIWTDVLGRNPLTPEENFFESGGNPAAAIRFCDQIHAELGRAVPALALYAAPTLSRLAHVLSNGEPVRFSNALLLKPGTEAAAVFFLHGLGGNVSEFFELVRCIDWGYPIYGLQAQGSDGLANPLDQVETMAEYHIEAIRQLQPRGPYRLCGYSLGGLVALEIARQLRASGAEVAMLSMIDAYPHAAILSGTERFAFYVQLAIQRINQILAIARSENPTPEECLKLNEKTCGPAIVDVTAAAFRALRNYRPTPYSERVWFLSAQRKTTFPKNPAAVWKNVICDLAIEEVPGTHHDMLQTSAPVIASALSRYIAGA